MNQSLQNVNSDNVEKNLEIFNGLQFHDDNLSFVENLKKELIHLDLIGLDNVSFVNLEGLFYNGDIRSNHRGVDIAEKLLSEDDSRKIVLYSFLPILYVSKEVPKLALLLDKENVHFLQLPFTTKDIVGSLSKETKYEIEPGLLVDVQQGLVNYEISKILHDVKKIHVAEDVINEDPSRVAYAVKRAKEYFSTLKDATDKEVFQFLLATRNNMEEVMKGKNIQGVFCDIEGTLLNGDELNHETLELLKKYETEGKDITLWTNGDVDIIQPILYLHGVMYPLKSKVDHAGASAEIVIDNEDNNTFFAKTKIYAKKFIKV